MRYGIWRPGTPNMQSTRFGESVEAVVIHRMVGYLFGTDSWFKTSASGASTHFGIGWATIADEVEDDVSTYQWVDTNDTAWGWSAQPTDTVEARAAAALHPSPDLNRQVIHVELGQYHADGANLSLQPFRPSIYRELNRLLRHLAEQYPNAVLLEHNDVSSKPCPGPIQWGQIGAGYGTRLSDMTRIEELTAALTECRAVAKQRSQRIYELTHRKEELVAQVHELRDQIDEMEALIAELEGGRVEELEGMVIQMRRRLASVKAAVAAVSLEVEAA